MTAENETPQAAATSESNRPTHYVRKKIGAGKKADFETLGAAWDRGDGSLYIKLHGTQIVDGGFYVFPAKDSSGKEESGQ
jgi:hypothetical protein